MSMYMLNKQASVQLLVLAPHYECNETKPARQASVAHQDVSKPCFCLLSLISAFIIQGPETGFRLP